MARRITLSPQDRVLASTTVCFDIAALELLMPLLHGAQVVLLGTEEGLDPERVAALIERRCVTVMQATPSLWQWLIGSGWRGRSGLTALCGGEALTADLARSLAARCGRLFNVYGPTETTIWSTLQPITADRCEPVLIGRPLANTQVFVLDAQRRAVPPPVVGELCIGGEGLARGYWRRPDLTAERFIAHPFDSRPGARLYRTGDRARWTHDGALECLGRDDGQVKLRGHRIELAEIEHKLREHAEVAEAVLTLQLDEHGVQHLVAHLVTRAPTPAETLRQHLLERLPAWSVPTRYRFVDALPLTPNGKVDRRALAAAALPGQAADTPAIESTATEARLCRLWSTLLGCPVQPDDDFFALGGHSLLALRLMSLVGTEFGVPLSIGQLLNARTVRRMAALLATPAAPRTPLVALREGFGQGSVVIVPGVGASLVAYRALAEALPEGLAVHGLDGTALWLADPSFADAAAQAAAGVVEAGLAGPIWLFGHSLGGLLALELARRLALQGLEVPAVVLLDTLAPGADAAPAIDTPWALAQGDEVAAWAVQLRRAADWQPMVDAPYAGRVVVARAEAAAPMDLLNEARRAEADLGWSQHLRGEISVLGVAGDHFSMIEAENIAAAMDRLCEAALMRLPVEA